MTSVHLPLFMPVAARWVGGRLHLAGARSRERDERLVCAPPAPARRDNFFPNAGGRGILLEMVGKPWNVLEAAPGRTRPQLRFAPCLIGPRVRSIKPHRKILQIDLRVHAARGETRQRPVHRAAQVGVLLAHGDADALAEKAAFRIGAALEGAAIA
jgi:hypothetical protein